jgi:predicted PurR-regulated permease PerM
MGIWGLLFAVPIAAVIRILLEFSIDLLNTEQLEGK